MRKLFTAVVAGLVAGVALASTPAMAQSKDVLVVLWRGWSEADVAFRNKLKELNPGANLVEVDGEQDRAKLAGKLREKEADITGGKFAAIYSHGTTATQVAQTVAADKAPIVFNIVFDPVGAKLVPSLKKPGGTITGATNGVPIDAQFDALTKLTPIKKMVVLFNAREANSNIAEQQVSAWAKKNGVELVSRRVAPGDPSLDEVLKEINEGKLTADVLYATADSFLGSKAGDIQAAIGDKMKLLGATQTFVLRGWLAAFAPTVEDLGSAAAELTAKVVSGTKPGDLDVVLPTPKIIISKAAAAKHGVTIPAGAKEEK